jgi:hypothetical protein
MNVEDLPNTPQGLQAGEQFALVKDVTFNDVRFRSGHAGDVRVLHD